MREVASNIVSDGVGIILLSHGDMAAGVAASAQMIFGPQDNLVALCLQESDQPDDYREKISEWADKFNDNCLMFVDLMGGTPYNQLLMYAALQQKEICAIAGMNLPMIIEVLGARSTNSKQQLVQLALQTGKDGVVDVGAILKEM